MGETSCCTSCSRVLLILLNLAVIAVGLALIAANLYVNYNQEFEPNIRAALMDTNPNPYDVYTVKNDFRLAATTAYWVMIGFGIAIVVVGLIGVGGSCALSRGCNGFYITLLVLLIIAEVAIAVFITFYKSRILDYLQQYLSLAFGYNLQDASIIRSRFNCCGDGTSNSYNSICQGVQEPNCLQLIDQYVEFALLMGAVGVGVLVAVQVLTIIFSSVLICHHKYQTLSE